MSETEMDDMDELFSELDSTEPEIRLTSPIHVDTGDSADDFMASMGMTQERTVPDITKPWMKHHRFVLVKTIAQLNEIVDAAIACGECALDLETEGLDSRIFYDDQGKPYTKHKIVGFCLSYDGITGFYAPIRHNPEDGGDNLNLPVAETEVAITRLCVAAQPKPTEASFAADPLSFREFSEKNKVVLYFWNAKFDHEFLYPITGIDWWHPDSFEDGNLAYYTYYSGDRALGLKAKAKQELLDPEGNPYEMIGLKELFVQGRKKIEFNLLSPEEPGCVKYACSDAICTFLLCTTPRAHEKRQDIFKIVKEKYGFTYKLEKQTSCTGRWMERPRVRVNKAKIEVIREANLEKMNAMAAKIQSLASARGVPLDLSSPKQLSDFLFTNNGLNITMPESSNDWPDGKPPLNEKSGQFKTDADTLERMFKEHPNPPEILEWIVAWREFDKMEGTYLKNMVNNVDPRSEMRFQFKQTGAQTGRFSAPAGEPDQGFSGIPIHGIPGTSALRKAFEAREGYTFVKADYAGQELRVVTNVSGEEVWLKEFQEGTGDLHTITARAFFGKQDVSKDERKKGKIANFALIYGGGPAAIMRATGCDKVEGIRRKNAFDKALPTFAKWVKGQHKKVKQENGIWNPFGRWIAIPPPKPGLPPEEIKRQEAGRERAAGNFPIQSCLRERARILTDHGYIAIGELINMDVSKMSVWTGTKWASFKVLNMGVKKAADILLKDGTIIACETGHKVLTLTEEGYVWAEFSKLKPGTRVATSWPTPVEFKTAEETSADKWRFQGKDYREAEWADQGYTYLDNAIFRESLINRKALIEGLLGSESTYSASPSFLRDLKDLLRTVGIASYIEGSTLHCITSVPSDIYKVSEVVETREMFFSTTTYTLAVEDPLHRYEADGVITKNCGADIMKISLVLLFKDFYKRGWLRQNNGDDSVRLLLTVHDEIVFEIKNERVQESLKILTELMVKPAFMAQPPHSPRWRVPLVVEPLIGLDWAGEFDYGMLMHGKPLEEGYKLNDKRAPGDEIEIIVGDRVFHKIPPWLEGMFVTPYLSEGKVCVSTHPSSNDNPSPVEGNQISIPMSIPLSVVPTSIQPISKVVKADLTQVFTVKVSIITRRSLEQIRSVCGGALDPDNGQILCLQDAITGKTLIEPSRNIRVNPEKLARKLKEINLSNGVIYPYIRAIMAS